MQLAAPLTATAMGQKPARLAPGCPRLLGDGQLGATKGARLRHLHMHAQRLHAVRMEAVATWQRGYGALASPRQDMVCAAPGGAVVEFLAVKKLETYGAFEVWE